MLPQSKAPKNDISWPRTRPALMCILCGRQVGEVVDGRAVHHPGCSVGFRSVGGMLRCCNCGGSVTVEEGAD